MSDGHLVRARKFYRCEFCRRLIFKGSRYWYERITPWDHPDNESYSTLRLHKRCMEAWGSSACGDCDDEWPDDTHWWRREVLPEWWLERNAKARRPICPVCTKPISQADLDNDVAHYPHDESCRNDEQ